MSDPAQPRLILLSTPHGPAAVPTSLPHAAALAAQLRAVLGGAVIRRTS